jgi:beta-1,4-N-acetylglucosaminyltransferase
VISGNLLDERAHIPVTAMTKSANKDFQVGSGKKQCHDGQRGQSKNRQNRGDKSTVLVTVGTTKFDALTRAADSMSLARLLASQGYTKLVLQVGGCRNFLPSALVGEAEEFQQVELFSLEQGTEEGAKDPMSFCVEWFRYMPNLADIIEESGLVISHAGAGSIFESLRARKRLVAVPNPDLMDNHQTDLCNHLKAQGFLEVSDVNSLEDACARIEDLARTNQLKAYVSDDGRGIGEHIANEYLSKIRHVTD